MKRYHRYEMDFGSKAARLSGICDGLPILLLSVYYFLIQDISTVSLWNQLLNLWLPLLLCLGWLVLLRIVKWNSPGSFAIIGGALCFVLMLQLFGSGNVLRIILGIALYLIGGGLLILCAGGYLPGRLIAALAFLLILVLRFLFFGKVSGFDWLREISCLSVLLGLVFLPISFRDPKNKE